MTSDAAITGDSVTVEFRAGQRIILESGFSVSSGAVFAAVTDPVLKGAGDAYVQDDSPRDELIYAARFYVDPTLLSLADADVFENFAAFDQGGSLQFQVYFKMVSGQPNVYATARDDGGAMHSMETVGEIQVPDGWHWIEVGWSAASGPGANNGSLYLCVDDLANCSNLENLDTDQASIGFVRLGAMGSWATTPGFLDLDDFMSMRQLWIGP